MAKNMLGAIESAFFIITVTTLQGLSTAATVRCNYDGFVETCGTADTATDYSCCNSIVYAKTYLTGSAGYTVADHPSGLTSKSCCRGRTTPHTCTNDFGLIYCNQNSRYCCGFETYRYGTGHSGCCDYKQTSCLRSDLLYTYCGSNSPYCCRNPYEESGTCVIKYSSCCSSVTTRPCIIDGTSVWGGGNSIGGKGAYGATLSALTIALVVIFVSLAVLPLPLVSAVNRREMSEY